MQYFVCMVLVEHILVQLYLLVSTRYLHTTIGTASSSTRHHRATATTADGVVRVRFANFRFEIIVGNELQCSRDF